ncbi:MAG: type III pantothenate kinase [Firmicutes bacterium]|nr:type III pantothenate kinase [Bacillota bacterium]
MLLVIDIGNTNTVLGLYQGEECRHHWRCASDKTKTEDEYAVLLRDMLQLVGLGLEDVTAAALSSTVPPLVNVWRKLCRKYMDVSPLVVSGDIRTDLEICLDNPRETGPDRIVNSVAGRAKYGNSLIVVDLGTATTFDCVSAEGKFLGGVIAPGLGSSADALFNSTARLPRVAFDVPCRALATNTVQALQSGLVYGFAGLLDGIVKRLKAEMGGEVKVIATGGLAGAIARVAESVDVVDSMLTLDGLKILYDMNRDDLAAGGGEC